MNFNLHIPIFFCNFAPDFVQHQMYWLRVILIYLAHTIITLAVFAAVVLGVWHGYFFIISLGNDMKLRFGETGSKILTIGSFLLFIVIMMIIAEISDRIKKRKKKKENKDGLSNV